MDSICNSCDVYFYLFFFYISRFCQLCVWIRPVAAAWRRPPVLCVQCFHRRQLPPTPNLQKHLHSSRNLKCEKEEIPLGRNPECKTRSLKREYRGGMFRHDEACTLHNPRASVLGMPGSAVCNKCLPRLADQEASQFSY